MVAAQLQSRLRRQLLNRVLLQIQFLSGLFLQRIQFLSGLFPHLSQHHHHRHSQLRLNVQ